MTPIRHSLLYMILNFFVLCFPHKPHCQHARIGMEYFIHVNTQILALPACCSCSHLLDSVNKEGFLHQLA